MKLTNNEKLSIFLFYKDLQKLHLTNQSFYQNEPFESTHFKILAICSPKFEWLIKKNEVQLIEIINNYPELLFFINNFSYTMCLFLQKNHEQLYNNYQKLHQSQSLYKAA